MSDESCIVKLIQRFDDFEATTKENTAKLDRNTSALFTKLNEVQKALDRLPCDGREKLTAERQKNIDDKFKGTWVVLSAAWVVISCVAYAIFEAWMRLIKL